MWSEFDRFAVRRVQIRPSPRVLAVRRFSERYEPARSAEALQGPKPVPIIRIALVWITLPLCRSYLLAQRDGPFAPREVTFAGETHRERKRRCLPWRGEYRFAIVPERDVPQPIRTTGPLRVCHGAGSRYASQRSTYTALFVLADAPHRSRPSKRTL